MHRFFDFRRERSETEVTVPCDIYNFVKADGIAHSFIYHKRTIEKKVIGSYNIQFFFIASKDCGKAGVKDGLPGYN